MLLNLGEVLAERWTRSQFDYLGRGLLLILNDLLILSSHSTVLEQCFGFLDEASQLVIGTLDRLS